MKRHGFFRVLCASLCAAILAAQFPSAGTSARASEEQTFLLTQAQQLALSKSDEIEQTYNQILLKKMKYTEAVEAIKAKVKNMKSFRWSPLLNFKFPQKLDMKTEYDLNVKPLTIQIEINVLQHKMDNLKYSVLCSVNKAYLDAYVSQMKAGFAQDRLDQANQDLKRNEARLLTGNASQTDVDTMKNTVQKLTTGLTEQLRNFESAKSKLSDLTGLDVTSGYTLKNPMTQADIPREQLEAVTRYTLQNDQTCYEAKMAVSTAKLNLDSYMSLMRKQYGSKMDRIQPFVNMAEQGQKVDYAAFQIQYKQMLTALDKPWAGKYHILFFSFPKEWLKGEISGTRYIEDEMYAAYTSCQEYSQAVQEQTSTEKAIRDKVSSSFDAMVTARNAYLSLESVEDTAKKALDQVLTLNKLGQAEYSEVKDKQNGYDEAQSEALDSLSAYDGLLLDFDALTCGAVTQYLNGKDFSTQAGAGGDSYVSSEDTGKPGYYIYTDVENMVFVFGLNIPKDFKPEITQYEIWYEGTQIGLRTAADKEIRHLAMDYQGSNTLTVRLFNGNDFVAECKIDTTVPKGELPIEAAKPANSNAGKIVGSYTVSTSSLGGLSTSKLTLKLDPSVKAGYYGLADGSGASISSADPYPIDKSFSYLTLLIKSLDSVKLTLYDKNKQAINHAKFDESTQSIVTTD